MGKKVIMVMYNSPWNRSLETDLFLKNCHFAPIGMTVFDGNQEIIPFSAFSFPKNCVRTQKGIIFALEKIE